VRRPALSGLLVLSLCAPLLLRAEAAPAPSGTAGRVAVPWKQVQRSLAETKAALKLHGRKQYARAVPRYRRAIELDPNQTHARYNAACALALLGEDEAALALLGELAAMGGTAARLKLQKARDDADFAGLRDRPEFARLTAVEAPPPGPAYALAWFGSDPFEQYCVSFREASVNDDPDDTPGCRWAVVEDCATAQVLHREVFLRPRDGGCLDHSPEAVRGADERVTRWLLDIGAEPWALAGGAPKARAEAWYAGMVKGRVARRWGHDRLGEIRVAPSGARLAIQTFRHEGVLGSDEDHRWTVVPATTL